MYCDDSGEVSGLFYAACVFGCMCWLGLPLGGVVKGILTSSVGHGSDVSIGGISPYLFMSTVV